MVTNLIEKGKIMATPEDDEFLTSLQTADELSTQAQANPQASKKPQVGFSGRRKRGGSNVPFNHSVLKETAEGFYDIAVRHDWTMNKTLTEAYKLLAQADKKGQL